MRRKSDIDRNWELWFALASLGYIAGPLLTIWLCTPPGQRLIEWVCKIILT